MSDETPLPATLERDQPALMSMPAIQAVNPAQLAQLRRTLSVELTDDQLNQFLEVCLAGGFNPWAGEAFADVIDGRLMVMVGRDGLLKKAREHQDYAGYDAGVIREGDALMVGDPDPDARHLRGRAGVRLESEPTSGGDIIGAWCVGERAGMPPRFFYAPMAEYRPSDPPADSSWVRHPSVMIEKVAISVVHRTLYGITGIHDPAELDRMRAESRRHGSSSGQPLDEEAEAAAIDTLVMGLQAPLEFRQSLAAAIRQANQLEPRLWSLAVVQMKLVGQDRAALERELANVTRDVHELRQKHGVVDGTTTADDPPADPEPHGTPEQGEDEPGARP